MKRSNRDAERRQWEAEQQARAQQEARMQAQRHDNYDRAYGLCMEARGYQVR